MSKTPNDYLPTVGSSFKGTPKVCSSLKLLCVFIIWTDLFKYTKQLRSQDLQFVGHSSYAEQICSSSEFFGSLGTYAQAIAITLKILESDMWITSEGEMIYCVISSSQKIKIRSFLHPSTHHFTQTHSPRFLQNTKLISELRFKALMTGKLIKFVQFTQNLIHHNFASYTYKFNLRCILIGRFLQRLLTELLGQDVHG